MTKPPDSMTTPELKTVLVDWSLERRAAFNRLPPEAQAIVLDLTAPPPPPADLKAEADHIVTHYRRSDRLGEKILSALTAAHAAGKAEGEQWAGEWHRVVEVALTILDLSPALGAAEAAETIRSQIDSKIATARAEALEAVNGLRTENARLMALIGRPYIGAWADEVIIEAAHQRERFGAEHDTGKAPEDWFWLLGYLLGKCLAAHKAGDMEKARHHTVSSGAALAHWAAAIAGDESVFRPGLGSERLAALSAQPLAPREGE